MLGFLGWLIIGLIAGGLARLLMPGRQPMGLLMTMVLGLVGSMIGGFVSMLLFGQDAAEPGFHPAGLIGSTIGAILVLAIYVRSSRSRITR